MNEKLPLIIINIIWFLDVKIGWLNEVIDFHKIIGYSNPEFPALDPTTPQYEYLSYQECCRSLNRPERLTSWLRYQNYYKNNFNNGQKKKSTTSKDTST